MTDVEWANDLGKTNVSAQKFDDTIERIRHALELPVENTSATQKSKRTFAQPINDHSFLFSPGDQRVWHGRARAWVQQIAAVSEELNSDSGSSDSDDLTRSQTELVEALIGHGIFRDNDLSLTSVGYGSEIESSLFLSDISSRLASPTPVRDNTDSSVRDPDAEISEADMMAYEQSKKRHRKGVESTLDFEYFNWYNTRREDPFH